MRTKEDPAKMAWSHNANPTRATALKASRKRPAVVDCRLCLLCTTMPGGSQKLDCLASSEPFFAVPPPN